MAKKKDLRRQSKLSNPNLGLMPLPYSLVRRLKPTAIILTALYIALGFNQRTRRLQRTALAKFPHASTAIFHPNHTCPNLSGFVRT
jgi:hypothetical protein